MALPVGAKAFNVIREDSSTVYMNTVPAATSDNINEIKNIPVVVMSYYKVKIGIQYTMKV